MIKSVSLLASVSGAALLALGLTALPTSSAQACGYDAFTGSICTTAASFCPEGTVSLQAPQPVPQGLNQALYALLGTNYGTSANNVVLPNLSGRVMVGTNGSLVGVASGRAALPIGTYRGENLVTLTQAQLALHNHAATFTVDTTQMKPKLTILANGSAGTGKQIAAATPYLSGSTIPMWMAGNTNPVAYGAVSATITGGFSSGAVTNAPTGNGKAFSLLPPSVALMTCIVSNGTFPIRQ